MKKILTLFIIAVISEVFTLSSYAGSDGTLEINTNTKEQSAEVKDCFETVNRGIFAFNQGLDKIFFKPVAKGYRFLPKPIRSGTSSAGNIFFSDATSGSAERQGIIRYDHSDDAMKFNVNDAERMRIDSNGKVNIGDTQMSSNLLNVEDGTAAAIDIASPNDLDIELYNPIASSLLRWIVNVGIFTSLPNL